MAKFLLLLGLILFALSSSLKEDKKQETPLVPHSSNKKIELNADNWLIRSEQMAKIRYEVTPEIGESCKFDY